MALPTMARCTFIFRPYRSDAKPQMGLVRTMAMPMDAWMIPAQREAWPPV